MKKTIIAYTAGIIDGDGWIGIERKRGKVRTVPKYRPTVSVTNTNPALKGWLKKHWGGSVVEGKGKKPSWKGFFIWRAYSISQVEILLKEILPHLVLKKKQAALVLECIKNTFVPNATKNPYKTKDGKFAPIDRAILKERDRYYQLLKKLNKRGHTGGLHRVAN